MKLNSTCKICNKSFNTIGQLGRHIYSHNITGKIYYDMFFKENNEGLCENCGKPTEFYKFSKGYRKTCCNKCYRELSVKNWRSTMNDKYDGKYYSSTDEFNEKRKQTCLEKYGSEFYYQSDDFKIKAKNTLLNKYGYEYALQIPEIIETSKEKRKQTCLEKYGVPYIIQDPHSYEKARLTCLERYGTETYTQTDEFKNRYKQTCLERYGTEFASQSDIVKNKVKQTCLERYGVESIFQSPEIHRNRVYGFYADNGKWYDSRWEYLYECYLIKNNIKYVYQPNIIFEYNDINKKPHKYLPDFLINDKEIIEIKGPHFFDINGNFIDPYDKSKEAQYNAQLKYKCMIDNNVTILQKNDLENLGIILI